MGLFHVLWPYYTRQSHQMFYKQHSSPSTSCLRQKLSRTSSWSLWYRRACHRRRAGAGRASRWLGSPSQYVPPPPLAACRTTPAGHRGRSAHQCHTTPPDRTGRQKHFLLSIYVYKHYKPYGLVQLWKKVRRISAIRVSRLLEKPWMWANWSQSYKWGAMKRKRGRKTTHPVFLSSNMNTSIRSTHRHTHTSIPRLCKHSWWPTLTEAASHRRCCFE